MSAKRALTRFRGPDERAAEDRAWEVVRSAYQEREPVQRGVSYRRPALALTAVALVGTLALSPAGATVGRLITRALGVQHAAPALFSLPAPGRLLLSGPGGAWTVAADGSTRRLGAWMQASWSPHGLYITVARTDQLAAVDPRGTPRWTLARPMVSDPRWYSPTGYRIAYLSGETLRVIAGDGKGDHELTGAVDPKVAPAWRPGHPYQLAYKAASGTIVLRDADSGHIRWRWPSLSSPRLIEWSADGSRLLVLTSRGAQVLNASGRPIAFIAAGGQPAPDAAISADGRAVALLSGPGLTLTSLPPARVASRRVFAGQGLRQLAFSPNGQWLLVTWPAADQLIFVHVTGRPRILAASRIAEQFSLGSVHAFPKLDGWCCTAQGPSG